MMEQKPRSRAGDNLGWLFGALLIILGAAALVGQFVPINVGGIVAAVIFLGGGIAFFLLSIRSTDNRWALIPGYVLFVIGLLIVYGTLRLPDPFIPIFVMLAIGFPFLYVYFRNPRQNWWALIPAYVMAAIAGVIAVGTLFPDGPIIPTYVMFAIALPFYYVYVRNRTNWWALIPAGIMTVIGVGLLMAGFQLILPIVLIGVGLALLVRQFNRRERIAAPQPSAQPARTGPKADKPPSV